MPAGGEKKEAGKDDARAEAKQMESLSKARDGKQDKDKSAEEFEITPRGALAAGDAENFFGAERRKSGAIPTQLYRKIDPTKEWAENNYYHLPIGVQLDGLVPVSPFWADYARHAGDGPFLTKNLADASRNFSEICLALAVLDLPFDAGKADVKFDGGKMTYTPAGPVVAFHEEARPTAGCYDLGRALVIGEHAHCDRVGVWE